MHLFLEIHPEVKSALAEHKAVVALESTIISHGMPYPQNVNTAIEVEDIVRKNGAVPATIAIFNGKCYVGLTKDQLEYFASAKDVWKVSLRDMPYVISKKLPGATTVAATMRIASMAGIKIFVTGGIGGVHRNANETMDVSADLTEMEQTSVAVVSAGIKSILDIGLTLEYLETKGIPVVTIGQNEFPGFYSGNSGFSSPLRLDDIGEISNMLHAKWQMGLNGSVLIANPVPAGQGILAEEMEVHIQKALNAAKEKKISGKDVTPFLLQYISAHTKGESLEVNIALIKNNAKVGAELAVAWSKGHS
ncbi:MAG TPA: pseudouridine-5'-phosphate glycosidase [Chitinophagaceae bacterium]|jgi:pseudouridine-5'-phosphate glycosidase|nr:pseudouridine-5'-phosphate glycosidase [Chitinophagaceae bacterium]